MQICSKHEADIAHANVTAAILI